MLDFAFPVLVSLTHVSYEAEKMICVQQSVFIRLLGIPQLTSIHLSPCDEFWPKAVTELYNLFWASSLPLLQFSLLFHGLLLPLHLYDQRRTMKLAQEETWSPGSLSEESHSQMIWIQATVPYKTKLISSSAYVIWTLNVRKYEIMRKDDTAPGSIKFVG